MTVTAGYDPRELSPKVIITDYAGSTQYTYESATIASSPTQDFKLTDLRIQMNGNGNYGSATLVIADNGSALVDSTLRRGSLIKRQWDVQIYLGKTSGTLQRWFYGKIVSANVIRPGTGQQGIALDCVGWGVILKERITRIVRNQDKDTDGLTLLDSDTKTRLDNLILDIFNKVDHQIDENIQQINSVTAAVADPGLDSASLDIKVANVNELGNTYAGFIARMAGLANADWYVDSDRKLVVRDAFTYDSGFLFTNNLTGIDAINWSPTKIGYLKNQVFGWTDSTFDSLYSWIHGFGHFAPSVDVSYTTAPDAADNLNDNSVSIPITPTRDNIFKIALRMTKTGTPASAHEIQIVGDDSGSPDATDIRRVIRIPKETLQALGTSTPATWAEYPVTPKLEITPNEQLYIVFPAYGDASNTVNINYKSGVGSYFAGASSVTGSPAYRVYSAKRLMTSLENTVVSQKLPEPREKLLPIRGDLEEQTVRQAMIQAGLILGKQRRVYQDVTITPTTDRIPLASYCRLQDSKSGLDIKAIIDSYEIEMHSNNNRLGADSIKLSLDELYSI
tara:strand:- start:776 stop:2464 length:1689 start_codon:yes stop_codon:yes gene_type:complete